MSHRTDSSSLVTCLLEWCTQAAMTCIESRRTFLVYTQLLGQHGQRNYRNSSSERLNESFLRPFADMTFRDKIATASTIAFISGELSVKWNCQRIVLSAKWTVSELVCQRNVQLPNKRPLQEKSTYAISLTSSPWHAAAYTPRTIHTICCQKMLNVLLN